MSTTLDANIDFFIKNNLNVLFRGRHGTGKTARVLEAFKKHNLKYQYFSASTMDPWVDFIGIPKEKQDGDKAYLELVRPKHFQEDDVEAIFLDEYNRAPKKVRNAVMELIQFKSINGKKFNNLKIVWAAINPEEDGDDKYDVEALDPAQIDRFHALIEVPFKPELKYFKNKYDEMTATAACTWWSELDPKLQKAVSPRRLDYAVEVYTKGGDIRFVLANDGLNINKLITELQNGPISANLKKLYDANDVTNAKTFLQAENNYSASTPYILKKKEYTNFFVPLLSDERIIALMNKEKNIEDFIFAQPEKFLPVIEDVSKNPTSKVARRAATILQDQERKKLLEQQHKAVKAGGSAGFTGFFNAAATPTHFQNTFGHLMTGVKKPEDYLSSTTDRMEFYKQCGQVLPERLDLAPPGLNRIVFDALVYIAATSHGHKVTRDMPNLIPMVNHILSKNVTLKNTLPEMKKIYLQKKFPNLWIK
jgi:hypothetical protein